MSVRVLLADDQALLRATFRLLIDAQPDLHVVGEAGTGRDAVDQARTTRPDVVVMDIRMPDLDGIAATAQISADPDLTGVHVLILTTFEEDALVYAALRAGAAGFLGKDVHPATLLDAIRTVAAGESLLSPTATTALIAGYLAQEPLTPQPTFVEIDPLTPRELQIVSLVARGLSNDEIAARLVISPATAKTHVNRAMTKTGARDRAQLVVYAYQTGLVRT